MSTINTKKTVVRAQKKLEETKHLNWMGGNSWDISNPLVRLRIAASSCFFGEPMYYHGGTEKTKINTGRRSETIGKASLEYLRKTLDAVDPVEWRGYTPKQLLESAIDAALKFDFEGTLKEAVRLRTEDNMRATPQVIIVRAAQMKKGKGNGLVRQYSLQTMQRVDDAVTQLAYQLAEFGKPVPNSLKKAWRQFLMAQKPYNLAKYRMENKDVKLIDLVRFCHPKGVAFDQLVKGELVSTGTTWESIISEKGSTKEAWNEAIDVMGHMALLRNLRNISEKAGTTNFKTVAEKLVNGAEKGRQLPFRYLSAYKALGVKTSPLILDAVEKSLEISLKNLPHFSGRTMSLCDNSGSAWGVATSSMGTMAVAEIANLSAVLTGMVSDEGYVGVFGDNLKTVPIKKTSSVLDQTNALTPIGKGIGGGTENGIWLFWDQAIRKKEHWDRVFVYSDMQAGHGGLYGTDQSKYKDYRWQGTNYIDVPKLIHTYRQQVNPNVKVFLVQVAGYQDTIIPEFYKDTYILGGWGDGLLRFAAAMEGIQAQPELDEEQVVQVQHQY